MRKNRALGVLVLLALTGSVFALTQQSQPAVTPQAAPQNGRQAKEAGKRIPEHVAYRQLFRHVVFLKQRAQEVERRGEDARSLRAFYQQRAGIDDRQAALLERIAAESEREVAQQDARARAVIDDFRADFPGGQIPQGQRLPPPPAELKALQEERNNLILRARERLRAALGEQEFARFDDYVQNSVAPGVSAEPLNRQRPAAPAGPRKQSPSLVTPPREGGAQR